MKSSGEEFGRKVMKSRLSGTIWMLTIFNGLASFAVLGLAFSAGRQSNGASMFESSGLMFAGVIALGMSIVLA